MHNYYPWLSNDVFYNGQLPPFRYPKPPPFMYSLRTYHHPVVDAGHNPFIGIPRNPIQFHEGVVDAGHNPFIGIPRNPIQFHQDRYLRIHSNNVPGYWNPPPVPDHPGNEEFRRRGNTIFIVKKRPRRLRRKSRSRKTNYGSDKVMKINMHSVDESSLPKYQILTPNGDIVPFEKIEKKDENVEKYEDKNEDEYEDECESESESESEEEVVEEEYECPYAYVDSNGKINKFQNVHN